MLRRARLANALCIYLSISLGFCSLTHYNDHQPLDRRLLPTTRRRSVSLSIHHDIPQPKPDAAFCRLECAVRVEGDVREYVDCELYKQLVSGCRKRAWRRQELAVMASCQGPDFQS